MIGWLVVFEHDDRLTVAVHSYLGDGDMGGFAWRKKDIIVRGILGPGKFVGSQVAAEVVAAAGGDMHGSEDFLVLNVSTGHRQHLRAKAKFAKFASDRVIGQLGIVLVKGCLLYTSPSPRDS